MSEVLTVARLGGIVTIDRENGLWPLYDLQSAGFICFDYSVNGPMSKPEYHTHIKALIDFGISYDGHVHHLKPDEVIFLTLY